MGSSRGLGLQHDLPLRAQDRKYVAQSSHTPGTIHACRDALLLFSGGLVETNGALLRRSPRGNACNWLGYVPAGRLQQRSESDGYLAAYEFALWKSDLRGQAWA